MFSTQSLHNLGCAFIGVKAGAKLPWGAGVIQEHITTEQPPGPTLDERLPANFPISAELVLQAARR